MAAPYSLSATSLPLKQAVTPPMAVPGNLDPFSRPVLRNPDGSVSTTLSFSREDPRDGLETLVPQVINGVKLSADAAWDHYLKTGQHFGKFKDWHMADAYAVLLHNAQEADLQSKGIIQQK